MTKGTRGPLSGNIADISAEEVRRAQSVVQIKGDDPEFDRPEVVRALLADFLSRRTSAGLRAKDAALALTIAKRDLAKLESETSWTNDRAVHPFFRDGAVGVLDKVIPSYREIIELLESDD